MTKYYVDVPERHYATYEVEADSHWEALQERRDNPSKYTPVAMEYSDELEFRYWMVVKQDDVGGSLDAEEAERLSPRDAYGLSKKELIQARNEATHFCDTCSEPLITGAEIDMEACNLCINAAKATPRLEENV